MRTKPLYDTFYKGKTLVLGHRGAKGYAPMNTIPSFALAMEQGAAGIELDVHRSKDGYPVIVHDFDVDATSSGCGKVADLTLAELKALDAGSWFSADFKGAQIPTLDEIFGRFGAHLFINVEIKSESIETDGVEQVVADCILRHQMQNRVIVSSFNPILLARFRKILPEVALGYLHVGGYEPPHSAAHESIRPLDCEALHPYHSLIDLDYMQRAREQGQIVNTWTVNDPQEALRLRDLGVNGIVTDVPDVILKALQA